MTEVANATLLSIQPSLRYDHGYKDITNIDNAEADMQELKQDESVMTRGRAKMS